MTQIQLKVQGKKATDQGVGEVVGESGVYFSLNYPVDVAQIGHKRGCCVNFYR